MADKSEVIINVAKDFSPRPGGRYRKHFKHSGEEFFEDVIRPHIRNQSRIQIQLDGVVGYPPSFWSEVFRRTVDEFGVQIARSLRLVAVASPYFIVKAEYQRERAIEKAGGKS